MQDAGADQVWMTKKFLKKHLPTHNFPKQSTVHLPRRVHPRPSVPLPPRSRGGDEGRGGPQAGDAGGGGGGVRRGGGGRHGPGHDGGAGVRGAEVHGRHDGEG